MPDHQHLVLPQPQRVRRHKAQGGAGSGPRRATPATQARRLDSCFEWLQKAFRDDRARLQDDPAAAEPEALLVLETAGSINEFLRAVGDIEGLEWLLDYAGDPAEPDEDGFLIEDRPDKLVPRHLYLVLSNQRGLEEILRFWRMWQDDGPTTRMPRGRAPWKHLFALLNDLRRWGPEDRLRETGLVEDWKERKRRRVSR